VTDRERIAFHVVTGFLGAGKTTDIHCPMRTKQVADIIKLLVRTNGRGDCGKLIAFGSFFVLLLANSQLESGRKMRKKLGLKVIAAMPPQTTIWDQDVRPDLNT